MLVLSRKADEAIVIGGRVRVVVAKVHGGRVRLRVQAPRGVTVDREEIHVRKKGFSRGPPDVFTQQEYDLLADPLGCVPQTFHGRQMYVRQGPALAQGSGPARRDSDRMRAASAAPARAMAGSGIGRSSTPDDQPAWADSSQVVVTRPARTVSLKRRQTARPCDRSSIEPSTESSRRMRIVSGAPIASPTLMIT